MTYFIFHSPRPIAGQCGTTMLEVLITIVVLAFGLLGLAGLQAVSLKNNNNAYYRSQATMFAYDITERMRVNKAAAKAGDYNIITTVTPSGTDVAKTDLIEWRKNIAAGMPNGVASISVAGGVVNIVIQWDGNTFTTQTGLY